MARPYPQIYLTDDVTPYTLQEIAIDGGATSAPLVLRIWNDKDWLYDSSPMTNAMLMISARVDANPFDVEGERPVDERFVRASITDTLVGTSADDEPVPMDSVSTPLGAWQFLSLGTLPPDTGREVTIEVTSPIHGAWVGRLRLFLDYGSTSATLARRVATALGSGVLADVLDETARRVTLGGRIVADGSDVITVGDRLIAADGSEVAAWENTITLNQNDSVPSALAAGESYYACISTPLAGGAAIGTKGARSATPVKPALPANHAFLAWALVAYEAGGTSIIDQADIDQSRSPRGDFLVEAGTGLAVTVGGGRGLSTAGDLEQLSDQSTSVTGFADATTDQRVYQSAAGVPSLADGVGSYPLADVDAAGGAISAIRDLRPRRTRSLDQHVLALEYTGLLSTAPLLNLAFGVLPVAGMWLDHVILELEALDPAWTAGSVVADIRSGVGARGTGVTLYTGDAGDLYKPAVAYTALRGAEARFHLVRGPFPAGTRFELDLLAGPTTGGGEVNQTVHALLVFRRF